MLRSALTILSGNTATSLLLLIRNLLVARMIPVADYGIAATFALVMAVAEMSAAFGLQQQIIQARDGDDPHFQAVLQGFQLLRGCLSGVVLFFLAAPMAAFMDVPQVTWAYQVLALVPVLNALVHFDIHRKNRHMVFWPMVLTGVLPALVSVLAVWPLVHWTGNWEVMLWAILIQAALGAVVSHVIAERRWKLALDRTILRQSVRFGWPLLANAVLLFFVFQGDRLIVGRELGLTALAIFSMGVTLTLTPTLVVAKSISNILLPRLSRATDPAQFARLATLAFELHTISGVFIALLMVFPGIWAVGLVLGPDYGALSSLLVWLAIQQAIRLSKGGPTLVALSHGQTENALLSNILRVGVMPLAWWFAAQGGELVHLIQIGIAGEFAGLILALGLQRWRQNVPLRPLLPVLALLMASQAALAFWLSGETYTAAGQTTGAGSWTEAAGHGLVLGLAVVLSLSLIPVSRELIGFIRKRQ